MRTVLVIPPDSGGRLEMVPRINLDNLYRLIGCTTVEQVTLNWETGDLLLADEDGLMRQSPFNPFATSLAKVLAHCPKCMIRSGLWTVVNTCDSLVGTVVFCSDAGEDWGSVHDTVLDKAGLT